MANPTTAIFLNSQTPAPPTNEQNVKFQSDGAQPQQSVTAYDPLMVGDTGSGGKSGNVPVPGAGDSAAGKFLHAGGSFQLPPMVIGFMLATAANGTTITPPGRLIAPRTGSVSKCKVIVNQVDSGTDLTFRIKKNGTTIFTADNTVSHTVSVGTLTTFTNLTSTPLPIAADDIFTLDITLGSASWSVTIQLE